MPKYLMFRTVTAPEGAHAEEVTRTYRFVFETKMEAINAMRADLRGDWVPPSASWWEVTSPDREIQGAFDGKPVPPPQHVRDAVVAFQRKMAERGEEVKPWSR